VTLNTFSPTRNIRDVKKKEKRAVFNEAAPNTDYFFYHEKEREKERDERRRDVKYSV